MSELAISDWISNTAILVHQDLFFRPRERLRDPFRGTLPPLLRASFKPIAIACFRLVTRRPELLFNVPRFFRCIADLTRFDADLPYFAIKTSASSPVQRLC